MFFVQQLDEACDGADVCDAIALNLCTGDDSKKNLLVD
jgi:hypothetical protein